MKTKQEKNINVLSLFDGMSCGQIALDHLGFKIGKYFASEIEKSSIKVAKHNYPNTIHIGNVTSIDSKILPDIDLLMVGSPCTDFSMAGSKNGLDVNEVQVYSLDKYIELKNNGFTFSGQSYLFWEFVRLFKETKPKYFLLENVKMEKVYEDIITKELGVEPIMIDSALVSAQTRKRLYWTNIQNIKQPEDRCINIEDVVYDDSYKTFTNPRIALSKKATKNYVKWDISDKGYWSQQDRAYYRNSKMCTLPKSRAGSKLNIVVDYDNNIYRRSHPIEVERYQTIPDNYTLVDGVSNTKRLEMVGNGWTIDVIKHILKYMKF
jgi:DNA (cytosine-5)-methyltransferase 3A